MKTRSSWHFTVLEGQLRHCVGRGVLTLLLITAFGASSFAQEAAEAAAPSKQEVPSAHELVEAATLAAEAASLAKSTTYARGRADGLRASKPGPVTEVEVAVLAAVSEARQVGLVAKASPTLRRVPEPTVLEPAPPPAEEAESKKVGVAEAALERAREAEARERDAALKALRTREREVAEQTLAHSRELADRKTQIAEESERLESAATTAVEPLRTAVSGAANEMPTSERKEKIDAPFHQLVNERRRVWEQIELTQSAIESARKDVALAETALRDLTSELGEQLSDASETPLAMRRRIVAQARLDLANVKLDGEKEVLAALRDRLQAQQAHVDDISFLIRTTLPHVTSSTRSDFYDVFAVQNWRDASRLVLDKLEGWRNRLQERAEAATSLSDQIAAVLLWLFALLPRLLAFAVAAFLLRFVPPLMRRFLDWSKTSRLFRRSQSRAIKVYELGRQIVKPAAYLLAASFVFDFVAQSFEEVAPLWGAVEAVFVFWLIDRASRTLFWARARRDAEGMTSVGGIDDLTPTEALQADLLVLDDIVADRAVRSVRIVVALVIAWIWALDLLYSFVGYSVISYIARLALTLAIGIVVYWALSSWRAEIARLFGRMVGERAPQVRDFVERHKDRFYGVVVVAVAAAFLIVFEIVRLGRTYLIGTEAFRRWNNFLFAKKIELQDREGFNRFEIASLSDDVLAHFGGSAPGDVLVERGIQTELGNLRDSWSANARNGSIAVVGPEGCGKSTELARFASHIGVDVVEIPAMRTAEDGLRFVADLFGLEGVDDLRSAIHRIRDEEPRTIILDGLEHAFVRAVGGYDALMTLVRVANETDRQHCWIVGSDATTWAFLKRVHDVSRFFAAQVWVPKWTAEQLRETLVARTTAAGLQITFGSLASADAEVVADEVVKTEQGYFRYLEEFTAGNLSAALHYWRASLSETDEPGTLAVKLFDRRHAQLLIGLTDTERFLLNAMAQQGTPTTQEIAEAVNLEIERCETLCDGLYDLGIVQLGTGVVRIEPQWVPLVLRHLQDSNLLVT